jgi:hypothetical protein
VKERFKIVEPEMEAEELVNAPEMRELGGG